MSRASVCAKKLDRNEGLVNDLKELAWIVCCAGDIIVYRAQHCRVRGQTSTRHPFTMSARLRERAALWWTHTFASPSVQE